MANNLTDGQRANLRLDHINGDITEIKDSVKTNVTLVRETREDMASLKTEVRIVGVIVLGGLGAVIAFVVNYLGSMP